MYQNIKLIVDYNQLIVQIIVTLALFIGLFFLHPYIEKYNVHNLLDFSLLSYLLFYMLFAPAKSLMLGALLFSIPFITYTIRKPKNLISMFNIFIFIIMVVVSLIGLNKSFPAIEGVNLSKISHDPILTDYILPFVIAGVLISLTIIMFMFFNQKNKNKTESKIHFVLGIIIVLIEVILLSFIMVYRTKTIYTSTYDFGIFTQMFYNMKNFNGMMTTLERSMLLSHNAVHVSPIYYLMLPFFMIFPYPETLQVLQVIIVSLGVIPLYLTMKHYKMNSKVMLIVVSMYIFHPAIISSSYYDLHENCFLAPLLLFVLYYGVKNNFIGLGISAVLTLLIKEDASIYLVFVGLFFLFRPKGEKQEKIDMIKGFLLIIVPALYFYFITKTLNTSGDGAMFWRYNNLNAYPDLGVIGIPLTLFQTPSYWLTTMFTPNKIYHLIVIFSVVGFLPLLNTKLSYYWLIIPLLLFNFSTTYPYQHQFGFQYYYGSMALLIFMVVLAFKDQKERSYDPNTFMISHTLNICSVIFISMIGLLTLSQKMYYFRYYQAYEEEYVSMKETLLSIPSDKKVLATGYLTTYLGDREVLYDYNYYSIISSDIEFDFIIVDHRINEDRRSDMHIEIVLQGYTLSDLSTEYIIIYEPV
jgi:uncharacterized membrane protein